MKKNLLYLLLAFALISNSNAQTLTNWKNYYTPPYYQYDIGNYLIAIVGGEIIEFNKSTYALTQIPFPDSMREFNPHNARLFDSTSMSWNVHMPYIYYGPNNSVFLKSDIASTSYFYDGVNWLPQSNYQGIDIKTITFLPFKGGSNFFTANDKLYKYDGITLSFYDSTNSPYIPGKYNYQKVAPNDDVFLISYTDIAVYHNAVWTNYDTAFFSTPHINGYPSDLNATGDFTFINQMDSSLKTFSQSTGNWSSTSIPSALIHTANGISIYNLYYDINGDLWIMGYGIFCRFDGNQFYDYYNNIAATYGFNSYYFMGLLSANNILIKTNVGDYFIYNPFSNSSIALPSDPQAKLTGNYLLPLLKDVGGNIWVGAYNWNQQNGLMKYDGDNWTYPPLDAQGIMGGVLCIEQDTGNSIVFGYGDLSSDGPVNLSGNNFTTLNNGGQYNHQVKDIAIDLNHHYWFGGGGAGVPPGLTEFYNGAITFYPSSASDKLYSVEIDSLSNKWVSYDSFDGVYKFNGSFSNYNKSNSGLPNDTVVEIKIQPNSNAIWFCTSGGFAKFYNGVWTLINTSNSPLPSNHAEYIYFADDSTIWFATQDGFASLKDTTWNVYTVYNSPLSYSDIESIVVDNNCNIWLTADGGLARATLNCGLTFAKSVNGHALQSNNTPAQNALIYVYKLNVGGTEWNQVDNVFSDNNGNFTYVTSDSGQFSFMIADNQFLFPAQASVYQDSSLVIQQVTPVNLNSNGNYSVNLKMQPYVLSAGTCTLNGQLQSQTERIGSVKLILMLNNQPVATVVSNFDGSFKFKNLAAATYSIWVDKMGLNNLLAPVVSVNNSTNFTPWFFNLYPDHLSLSPTGIDGYDLNDVINIFPNPFLTEINISCMIPNLKQATISIKNILGQMLFEKSFSHSGMGAIDLSFLQNGIYFLEVNVDDKRVVKKIVKSN